MNFGGVDLMCNHVSLHIGDSTQPLYTHTQFIDARRLSRKGNYHGQLSLIRSTFPKLTLVSLSPYTI